MELLQSLSTRFSNISGTIRSSIYKQGERNIIRNITNGDGYEGVFEIWVISPKVLVYEKEKNT